MEKPASQAMQDSTPLTTFVQADTSTFRELVQRLTGSSDTDNSGTSNVPQLNNAGSASEGAAMKVIGVKKPTFKLHERRQYSKSKLEIVKPGFQFKSGSPVLSPSRPCFHTPESILSPTKMTNSSLIPSPSKKFSNLSIFEEEEEGKPTSFVDLNAKEEEEKAIKERRFYLHPSPRSRPGSEPELLTLFPLTSPKSYQP
ncbi:VQ [Macleaya cordata]|uniref:VQ n=1 Tax=Macleaya cordata TaxID=56857 RepID=A0A200PSX8_MACCD|nr:VQ [Macleaya cordata]